jgi:hypothetical protein
VRGVLYNSRQLISSVSARVPGGFCAASPAAVHGRSDGEESIPF